MIAIVSDLPAGFLLDIPDALPLGFVVNGPYSLVKLETGCMRALNLLLVAFVSEPCAWFRLRARL